MGGSRSAPVALGAADFLRGNDKMAALMPAVTRMVALQKDCAASLPPMFHGCDILQYEAGQLILATPNAAVAAKLKQQLPKLQTSLLQLGWQVSAVKLKVQMTKSIAPAQQTHQLILPNKAISAFAELGDALQASPHNENLIAALRAMVQRKR
jgi:hypothetical protein